MRRDERAARIAWIQSRVRLNHIVHQTPRLRPQAAPQRAHHARRHGALETVRVADGDDELADAHALRAAELRGQQVRRVDANDRQVRVGIIADQLRLTTLPVRETHIESRCAVYDVAVRQDETVGREDEPRPVAVRLALAPPPAHLMRNLNVYDRRADALGHTDDRTRISIEQLVVRCVGRKLRLRAVPFVEARARNQFKVCVRLPVHLSPSRLQIPPQRPAARLRLRTGGQGWMRATMSAMVVRASACSTAAFVSRRMPPKTTPMFAPTTQRRLGRCRCNKNVSPPSTARYTSRSVICSGAQARREPPEQITLRDVY